MFLINGLVQVIVAISICDRLVIADLGSAENADAHNYKTSAEAEHEVEKLIREAKNTTQSITQSITQKQKDIVMLGIALAELCLELKLKSEDKDFNDYFVETETYLQALDKLEKKLEVKPSEASNYFSEDLLKTMRNNSNLEELKPMIALLQSIFKFEFNEVDDVLKQFKP